MVTGCSSSTITSVHSRMMETGGLREPPEHGLKKFWQEHFKMSGTRSEPNEGDKADDESHALVAESNRKKQSYVKKSSAGNSQSVNSEAHIHGFPGITEPSLTSAQHQQYSLQQQQLQQQQLEHQEQQQQQQILLHMLVEQHLAMEQNVSDPQIQSQIPVAYPGAGPQSTMLPVTHVLQQGQFQLYLQPPPKYTENQSAALKQWNQTAVVTFPVTSHPGTSFPVTPMQMASLPVSSFPGSSLPVSSLPVSSFPVNSLPVTSFPVNINQFSNLPQHSNQQHNSGISYSNVVTNSRPDISTKPAPNITRKRPTDLPTPLFQTAVPHHQLSFMPQQISTGNNSINEQKRSVDTACGQRQLPSQIFQQMSVNSGLRYQLQTAQGVFNIESVVPDNHHHLNVQQNEAETDAKTTANPGPSLSDINMESQNSTHQVTSCIYKPVPVLDKETGTTRIIYVPDNSENTPFQQQVLEVVATESNTSANIPQVIPDVESNIPITVHINNDGTFTLTMIEDNVSPQNQLIFTHFNSEANNARPTPQATPSEPRSAQMILPNSSQSLSSPNGSSINQSESPLPQSYLHPSQGGHSHLAPLQGSNSCTVTVPVLAHAHRVQTIEPTNVPKFFKTNSYADISVDTSSKVQHSVLPSQDGNTGMSTKEHLHKLVVSRKKKHSGGEDGQKKDVIEKELARKSRNVSGASNSSRKSVIISHVSTRKHHDSGTEALYRLLGVGTHSRHVSGNSDLGDRSRKSSGNSLISDTSSLPFSNLPSPNIFLDREKGIFCIQSEGGDQCEIEASPYIEEMLRLAEMEPHANFHGLSERCIFKHMVQSMNNASADNTTNVQAHDSDGGWRMAENVETETSNLVMEKSGLSLNENSSIPQLVEQAASGQLESMNTVKRKNKSNNEKTTKKARHRKILDSSKARRKSMASQDHSTVTRLDIGFELNETGDEIVVDSSHLKAN
ncbi:hypothetical protein DPMN_150425 [Dreissena polymorpha]|uniref:Uncharacterized protein n=2 Tax=Dreissena polymorpha TaxID=45954 RepID=A0A9D4J3B8_DREPO|nr:hypothetical protein DPMN_150425 [Dreissena polymorpha]